MGWTSPYDRKYWEIIKKWKKVKTREIGSKYTPIFVALKTAGRGKWAVIYEDTRKADIYLRILKRRKDAEKVFRRLLERARHGGL